jgi:hypothetical protein
MRTKFTLLAIVVSSSLGLVTLTHCGSDSGGGGASVSSLAQLPNSSAMLQSTGANVRRSAFEKILEGINLQTVSGTPPTLISLSPSNADTYFWGGLVATINTAGACAGSNKNKFWGADTATPGPGGMGACQMASSTGEALGRMLNGTSTLCYMKGITNVASGVTVTGGAQSTLFTQGEANKTVKVAVTGFQEGGRVAQSFNVFFTIYGTNAVGNDKYRYSMYMCRNGSISSTETLEVTKSTGQLTVNTSDSNDSGRGTMSVSAFLKASGSGFTFDASKDRIANVSYTGAWGTYKGNIQLTTGDLVKGKRWFYNSTWGSNKTYSVAAFSGTGVDSFKFLQACTKGISVSANGAQTWPYSSITEFRDTVYASVASSDLSPQCDSFVIADDSFYADNTVATLDSTGLDCSATTDATATMDFTDSAVDGVKDSCDGESRKLENYAMCDSSAVRTAEGYCRN